MLNKNQYFSPVKQRDFIWLAEYYDSKYLTEFDFETGKQNDFYLIDKSKLIKFGLIGHGYKFNFNITGGIFDLLGRKISFIYKVNNKYIYLTNKNIIYNDIITYKSAYSDFDPFGKKLQSNNYSIYQYNFGYKIQLYFENIIFNFKAICHIPLNQAIYLGIKLVIDQRLDGELLILKNEAIIEQVKAPLEEGVSGTFNWVVK